MAIVASGQLSLVDLNDSKQLIAYIGSSQPKTVIFNPNNSTYVPNYTSTSQVLTPQLFIAGTPTDVAGQAKSTKWYYQTNSSGAKTEITATGGGYTLGTGSVKTLTISSNVLQSNNTMLYTCEMVFTDLDTGFDVTAIADIELVKVTNGTAGTNAVIGVLSNESHTVPTDQNGANGNFTGASTTMSIFNGSTDDSANWTVTAGTPVGITGSLSGKTYTVTAMSADTGYVDLTATRSGYSSVVKRFMLSKSKQGQAPTVYWLITSVDAISKNKAGVFTPSNITVSGKSQTGTSAPVAYSGRYKISDTTDGTTYTVRYTSTGNEASYTYPATGTFASNVKAIKVELFLAGGTTNVLDEQIIPVVVDGTDGQNAVYATIWTPNGNMIKNGTGTVTAEAIVYEGSTVVTPTAHKWYIQDPTATTASGGDADGGNGWRLLNAGYNAGTTGYTTKTLTIPASAIVGVESFKLVATYGGQKYSDVCTALDYNDPILVQIMGLNTFKNGTGTTQLTAKLMQNLAEIDVAGTEYTYTWYLYRQDNTLHPTAFGGTGSATGKTVTVNASDVDVRANIICEISK